MARMQTWIFFKNSRNNNNKDDLGVPGTGMGRLHNTVSVWLLSILLFFEIGLFLAEQAGLFPYGKGIAVLICISVAAATIFLFVTFYILWALLFRSRVQYGLKFLLLLVIVFVVPCGWLATSANQAKRQRQAVVTFRNLGFIVEYSLDEEGGSWFVSKSNWNHGPTSINLPSFFHHLFGIDFFSEVKGISNGFPGAIPDGKFTNAAMKNVRALPLLRSVSIDFESVLETLISKQARSSPDDSVTDSGLENLASLTRLSSLTLMNNRMITDAGLVHLNSLLELQSLSIIGTSITGSGLEHLRRLVKLKELSLRDNPISNDGLKHLATFKNLRVLDLQNTNVTDAGLEYIRFLTQLQDINLNDANVTDAGLKRLTQLTDLRVLHLARTAISDAGLENLKNLGQLEQLDLSDTTVSDVGLEHLREFHNLKTLVLIGTKVSDDCKRRLKNMPQFHDLEFDDLIITFSTE